MDSILIRYKYHIKKVTSKTKTKTLIIRTLKWIKMAKSKIFWPGKIFFMALTSFIRTISNETNLVDKVKWHTKNQPVIFFMTLSLWRYGKTVILRIMNFAWFLISYIYTRVLFGSNKTKSRLNNYSKEKIKWFCLHLIDNGDLYSFVGQLPTSLEHVFSSILPW